MEAGFRKNIKRAGLNKFVTLINKPNHIAVSDIEDNSVRLLFIDGVRKDLRLFMPKLKSGAIIAFDDYENDFGGLVSVVNEFISKGNCKRKYLLNKTLVVELN